VTVHFSRPPRHGQLAPWLAGLWLHEAGPAAGHRRELSLPAPGQRIVFRLHGAPMRRYLDLQDRRGVLLPRLQWSGLRHGPLLRSPADAGVSLGLELRPGASLALFGVPADRLAAGLADLAALLPAGVRRTLLRLRRRPADRQRLDDAEDLLLDCLSRQRAHLRRAQAAQQAVAALRDGTATLAASAGCGLSHRAWLARVQAALGCPARQWRDLQRFDASLACLHGNPDLPLGAVALASGHADQAHFNRRFRRLAGVTPGTFRRLQGRWPRHLPLD